MVRSKGVEYVPPSSTFDVITSGASLSDSSCFFLPVTPIIIPIAAIRTTAPMIENRMIRFLFFRFSLSRFPSWAQPGNCSSLFGVSILDRFPQKQIIVGFLNCPLFRLKVVSLTLPSETNRTQGQHGADRALHAALGFSAGIVFSLFRRAFH